MNCPAIKIDIVDTIGAGDAFMTGAIYSILNNWSYKKMLAFSTYLASECLMKEGAHQTPFLNQLNHKYI